MLYVVATPIGNLGDITFRAVETLKNVDKIYCEDTRRTRVLLDHYDIKKPYESFHHHSSDERIEQIVRGLKNGDEIAYVSDAGTPGVADPAGKLVERCHQEGIKVSPLPGPSAVTSLLSVAGIYANEYTFSGYVPTKKGRQTFVKTMLKSEIPVVFFETAPRLIKLLDQIMEFGGENRKLIVGRELTKQFEQIEVGKPTELKDKIKEIRGEFVLVLSTE